MISSLFCSLGLKFGCSLLFSALLAFWLSVSLTDSFSKNEPTL